MKLKMMEYNGDMVLAVTGERQSLIIREEDGGFTVEWLAAPVFTQEIVQEVQEENSPADIPAVPVVPVVALESEVEEDAPMPNDALFEKLSAIRKELAAVDSVPPYLIFHNKTLREMVEKMPSDMQALGTVSGVGQAKLEKYGPMFLDAIRRFAA